MNPMCYVSYRTHRIEKLTQTKNIDFMKSLNELSYQVIGCALEVYKNLGPGLFETVYEKALIHELPLQVSQCSRKLLLRLITKG